MTRLTENAIEDLAIAQLEAEGYNYLYGPTIAPPSTTRLSSPKSSSGGGESLAELVEASPERDSYEDVLLGRLEAAVARLNPTVPPAARHDAIRQIQRLNVPDLIANNEAFHRLLTEGVPVTYQKEGAPL